MEITSPLSAEDINHVKERRLTAKLFTVLIRDFTKRFEKTTFVPLLENLLKLVIQNLLYLLPFYHELVVVNDDQDNQLEFNSCVSQIFNLLTTVIVLYKGQLKTSQAVDSQLVEPILILLLGFCHIGKEFEKMFEDEDKNAFLSAFGESVED